MKPSLMICFEVKEAIGEVKLQTWLDWVFLVPWEISLVTWYRGQPLVRKDWVRLAF